MAQEDIDQLFQQYIDVCNQAMQRHGDRFPYKYIWEAVEALQRGHDVDLTIYDDEPKQHYKVRLQDKHIDLVDESDTDDASGWRLNTSYLRKVVSHAEDYIEHPAKLDWDWLKSNSGVS